MDDFSAACVAINEGTATPEQIRLWVEYPHRAAGPKPLEDAVRILLTTPGYVELLALCERCLAHFERIRPEHLDDSPLMVDLRGGIRRAQFARYGKEF
jgi:hypothetical protein